MGSHLAEALLDRGCAVVVVDDLSTGCRDNVAHLGGRFEFIEADVSEHVKVDGPVRAVAHLASPASPADYLEMPIHTLKTGSMGTRNALGLARAKGAQFLLASTSEVYGDPLEHPQRESYWGNVNPVGPRSVYDEAKRFAEAMTAAYRRCRRVDAKIARIFNTYGPRMRVRDGRAVPNFIAQALRREDLTVYGDGSQTRSLCYVGDLVEGLIRLLRTDVEGPVNFGNPWEMTVREIAELIIGMTGSTSRIVYRHLPSDDPGRRRPDVGRAYGVLGWRPRVSPYEGLPRTIEWFRGKVGGEA